MSIDVTNIPAFVSVADTCEITEIYLQRPSSVVCWSMAEWFDAAHKLNDLNLQRCAYSLETKLYIVRNNLNRLPLETLRKYNQVCAKLYLLL